MAEEHVTIKKSTYNKILAGLVVVMVAFSFSLGFILGGSGKTAVNIAAGSDLAPVQQPSVPAGNQALPGRVQVSLDDDPQLGDRNAKLVMIEFSDFQCPFCERFFSSTLPLVKKEYVDTGKVLFVYRDFPLDSIHPQAVPAALAAGCADEQGRFWEYHDKIFQNQASLGDTSYKAWAADLGLDTTKFNDCYDSKKYAGEVQKDFQDGSDAGVSGTPTFYIGSPQKGYIEIVGAQPFSVIKQALDQGLA
ncbi:MAG: DsbA family protein [Candidatus Aenigmarchaeota archaeon]|nr:DsbA family protein [Candidatus Aenigmarchaeota archaeon]